MAIRILMATIFLATAAVCAQAQDQASSLVYFSTRSFARAEPATQGVYAARLDSRTGKLTPLGLQMQFVGVSWLLAHPSRPVLYVAGNPGASQTVESQLFSFAVDPASGTLRLLSLAGSGGHDTTHLTFDGPSNTIFGASFRGGEVTAQEVLPDGRLGRVTSVQKHAGRGPHPQQEAPHAHAVAVDPTRHYLVSPDYGTDRIFVYHFDAANRTLTSAEPPFEPVAPGAAPRHAVFHPNGRFLYVLTELSSEVRAYAWNARQGRMTLVESLSTYPAGYTGAEKSSAEIGLDRAGRHLYVSLRGDQSSLVMYDVDVSTGHLKERQRIPSQGKIPRAFAIDPSGRWMLVANEAGANVFSIDGKSGELKPTSEFMPMPIPATLTFVTPGASIAGDPLAIDTGKVSGTVLESGVHAYLGVPFAAPPTGELRWHEPVAVKPWTGVYDASSPRPACAQRQPAAEFSEDCLYLNVWTPPNMKRGAKLPVLVFIHGGGFTGGSASSPNYSGAELARKGVVTVTLAYRLGIFGFFAHPDLTRESGHNASGDWGSLDQLAGLRWIQHNIQAFGGDPTNVTIMGHSAGSESVYQLQASPLARGLFAKVSGWSGANLAPGGQIQRSLQEGEAQGLQVQQHLNAKDLNAMRAMPWGEIQVALSKLGTGPVGGIQTRPIVDGYFLPTAPDKIFKSGKQNDVPLYAAATQKDLGSAAQFYESVQTVAELRDAAVAAFGDATNEFQKLFPVTTDAQAKSTALIVSGNTGFGVSNRDWVRDQAATGKQPAYLVQWKHAPPPTRPGASGAPAVAGVGPTHGSDIPYWLGTYALNNNRVWSDWDKELSNKMQDTLIAFARTGNPNTRASKIPRYDPKNEQRTVFGDTVYVERMNTEQIEFLRAHTPKRPRPVQ